MESAGGRSISTAKAPRFSSTRLGGNFDRNPFTLTFFIKTSSPLSQAIWEKRPVCNAASFWGFRMTGNLWGAELDGD